MQSPTPVIGSTDSAIDTFLRALERRLTQIAALSRVNALLSHADPSLVLPLPALGLMRLSSDDPVTLPETVALRSLDPVGMDGDTIFTPVEPFPTIQPWGVKEAHWTLRGGSRSGPAGAEGRGVVDGCEVQFSSQSDARGAYGPLHLWIDLGPTTQALIARARVFGGAETARIRVPSPTVSLNALTAIGPASVHFNLEALFRNLIVVELPRQSGASREWTLSFKFSRPVPAAMLPESPEFVANVIPVWNSLNHRCPEFSQVEQHVSGVSGQCLFPLWTRDLGRRWKAWTAVHIGAEEASQCGWPDNGVSTSFERGEEWMLAFLPLRADGGVEFHGSLDTESTPVLTVVLRAGALEGLERTSSHVRILFRATTGAAANGLPAGTCFQACDLSGMPFRSIVRGTLLGSSWGGADGLVPQLTAGMGTPLVAALSPAAHRSVGNVIAVLDRHYGHCITLVDEYDLVRSESVSYNPEIVVRVRFRDARWSAWERRAILNSASMFLTNYLAGRATQCVRLVEEGQCDGASD